MMKLLAGFQASELASVFCASVAIYLGCCCVYQVVYYRFFHPLSKFPGPFWASVTRLWYASQDFKGDEIYHWQRMHEKYGPVIRVTPTLLFVSDPTALPDIYHRQVNKSPFYGNGSFGDTDNVFDTQDWKKHADLRKMLAGPYSFSSIKKLEPVIDKRVEYWIGRLRSEFLETGKAFDFAQWATYLVFDVISEVAFGKAFGFTEAGSDVHDLIKSWHDGLWAFSVLGRLYPMTQWIKKTPLKRFIVANPKQPFGIGMLMRMRDEIIEQRIRDLEEGKIQQSEKVDLLQHVLNSRSSPDGHSLPLEQIKAEVLLIIIAGADTTATILSAVLHHLSCNPSLHGRLLTEQASARTRGLLSSPVPQYDEVTTHLPLYCATVKEALRLSPAAPLSGSRMVSPEGVTLLGRYKVEGREGVEAACNAWIVNRDKAIWGEDAEVFRPERWLEGEEKVKVYNRYLMTFGYGTRVCLGKELAMMELLKSGTRFLGEFEVEWQREGQREAESLGKYRTRGGIAWFEGVNMKIAARNEGEEE